MSVPSAVLAAYVTSIYDSVTRSGFRSLVLVNGHGGNYVLSNVVQEAGAAGRRMALFPAKEDGGGRGSTPRWTLPTTKTCTRGSWRPRFSCTPPRNWSARASSPPTTWLTTAATSSTAGMTAYTASGVIGKPSRATAEKGKAVLGSLTGASPGSWNCWTRADPARRAGARQGVSCHADLTKGNILTGPAGVTILDFAVANRLPRVQELAVIAANLTHGSPEPLPARIETIASDVLRRRPRPADASRAQALRAFGPAAAAMELLGALAEWQRGNHSAETGYLISLGTAGLRDYLTAT